MPLKNFLIASAGSLIASADSLILSASSLMGQTARIGLVPGRPDETARQFGKSLSTAGRRTGGMKKFSVTHNV